MNGNEKFSQHYWVKRPFSDILPNPPGNGNTSSSIQGSNLQYYPPLLSPNSHHYHHHHSGGLLPAPYTYQIEPTQYAINQPTVTNQQPPTSVAMPTPGSYGSFLADINPLPHHHRNVPMTSHHLNNIAISYPSPSPNFGITQAPVMTSLQKLNMTSQPISEAPLSKEGNQYTTLKSVEMPPPKKPCYAKMTSSARDNSLSRDNQMKNKLKKLQQQQRDVISPLSLGKSVTQMTSPLATDFFGLQVTQQPTAASNGAVNNFFNHIPPCVTSSLSYSPLTNVSASGKPQITNDVRSHHLHHRLHSKDVKMTSEGATTLPVAYNSLNYVANDAKTFDQSAASFQPRADPIFPAFNNDVINHSSNYTVGEVPYINHNRTSHQSKPVMSNHQLQNTKLSSQKPINNQVSDDVIASKRLPTVQPSQKPTQQPSKPSELPKQPSTNQKPSQKPSKPPQPSKPQQRPDHQTTKSIPSFDLQLTTPAALKSLISRWKPSSRPEVSPKAKPAKRGRKPKNRTPVVTMTTTPTKQTADHLVAGPTTPLVTSSPTNHSDVFKTPVAMTTTPKSLTKSGKRKGRPPGSVSKRKLQPSTSSPSTPSTTPRSWRKSLTKTVGKKEVKRKRILPPAPPRKIVANSAIGETVLHKAAQIGCVESAEYYLMYGIIDANIKDNAGYTPLHEACVNNQLKTAKILLQYGAKVEVAAQDGTRPLHDAVENDNLEIVRLLISCGADPTVDKFSGRKIKEMIKSKKMRNFFEAHLKTLQLTTLEQVLNPTPWNIPVSKIFDPDPDTTGFDPIYRAPKKQPPQSEDLEFLIFDQKPPKSFSIHPNDINNRQIKSTNFFQLDDLLIEQRCQRAHFLLATAADVKSISKQHLHDNTITACQPSLPSNDDEIDLIRCEDSVSHIRNQATMMRVNVITGDVTVVIDNKKKNDLMTSSLPVTKFEDFVEEEDDETSCGDDVTTSSVVTSSNGDDAMVA